MNDLQQALSERFTDQDEIKDVAQHGCIGGVSGFIYNQEIREFFFQFEDEIQELLADFDYSIKDMITAPGDTINTLITTMVWMAVEIYCQEIATPNN
jgi:hypothetical protein